MTDSTPSLHVLRCCPAGNRMGCTLWAVQDQTGYGLGKFGTRSGALDFAHGRANDRNLQLIRAVSRGKHFAPDEITVETVIEVEEF